MEFNVILALGQIYRPKERMQVNGISFIPPCSPLCADRGDSIHEILLAVFRFAKVPHACFDRLVLDVLDELGSSIGRLGFVNGENVRSIVVRVVDDCEVDTATSRVFGRFLREDSPFLLPEDLLGEYVRPDICRCPFR